MWENTLWFDDVRVEPASLNEMLLSRDYFFFFALLSSQTLHLNATWLSLSCALWFRTEVKFNTA